MFQFIKSLFASAPVNEELLNEIKQIISSNKIVVYSKTYCPYCTLAKSLLNSFNQDYYLQEIDTISNGSEIQAALRKLTGQSTVPNIFIDGKHIGGYSELLTLNSKGKLKPLFK
jgi:glutaredoxin 3